MVMQAGDAEVGCAEQVAGAGHLDDAARLLAHHRQLVGVGTCTAGRQGAQGERTGTVGHAPPCRIKQADHVGGDCRPVAGAPVATFAVVWKMPCGDTRRYAGIPPHDWRPKHVGQSQRRTPRACQRFHGRFMDAEPEATLANVNAL